VKTGGSLDLGSSEPTQVEASLQREVPVQIRWLLACLALVGSSAQSYPGLGSLRAANAIHPSSALAPRADRLRSPSDDELAIQSHPWRNYRQYPPGIRASIRRAAIEQSRCRGIPNNLRACNRAWLMNRRLEQRGWCWGSEQRAAYEAIKHWLRCSNDPTYRRGYLGSRPPFSEREIREMTRDAAN
jgi:hypothetical protein